jgi:glycosidase
MRDNDTRYGSRAIMSTFIGNHDIPRAIHFASRQIGDCRQGSWYGNGWTADYHQPTDAAPYERLGVAFAVMLTNPGLPLIYYGDEVGLAGGGDPDNRRMMPWDDGALNAHQLTLRSRVRALARLRGQNPVLGRGTRTTLSSSADTWVYRMGACGTGFVDVTVAINRADSPNSVTIPAGSYTDLMTDMPATGGATMLPARSFLVLRPR